MKTLLGLLVLYYFRVCLCVIKSEGWRDDNFLELNTNESNEMMNGTLRNIVKKYHCGAEDVDGEKSILYGTKAWTFPEQDVNLTLRYPVRHPDDNPDEGEYIVTGVLVILYMDGSDSRGYITEGGLFTDRISMTFIISNISRLSYQFWLYGVSRPLNHNEYTWQYNLC